MDSKPLNDKSLNAKSLLLSILSLLSILFIIITLQASWNNPQEQTKLDLLQTDLILQATQVQDSSKKEPNDDIFQVLLGDIKPQDLYTQALSSYQEVISANKSTLARLDRLFLKADIESDDSQFLSKQRQKSQTSFSELSTRMGLLQVQTGDTQGAIATWNKVTELEGQSMSTFGLTAQILKGLWSEPTMLFPNAETQIRRTLDGRYRKVALTKLYTAQQRSENLPKLEQQAQIEAVSAVNRLIVINSIPLIGGGLGLLLWLGLLVQWIFFRKSSPFHTSPKSDLDQNLNQVTWQVPWGIETTWEVMVLWFTAFCLMTQFVLPLIFELLGIQSRASEDFTLQALLVLIPYILSVMPMLPILQASLASFRPLPEGWFRLKFTSLQWLTWGIGGYFAAVPLVLIVSAISQKFLQGQGGGNPLLPILTDSQNILPKFLLWTTLAIAAPFFEEYLFRGFLLPSLTKFLPVWSAIALSGFFFALAHLNIADIIPLTVLGIVMGFVYWRSKNLLSSMLLHCLWNSGSFFALIALGGK
ncbi:MAG: CPBP family intramembrane metalloprotease domain-containing protein [Pseudanabaena frigida]|uniref:CPBP family intramembrane metalloprotease domain-containing protein n=1 Tax=Pseudanabaena frigida TaxID=945775 RepID=A0A2W4Y705_9CYAN|nr:MAG: CPBP family intramembrane metalloprotease domain-containing protein [Pseudanabaena frigida]